jgi:hypothetical protein
VRNAKEEKRAKVWKRYVSRTQKHTAASVARRGREKNGNHLISHVPKDGAVRCVARSLVAERPNRDARVVPITSHKVRHVVPITGRLRERMSVRACVRA